MMYLKVVLQNNRCHFVSSETARRPRPAFISPEIHSKPENIGSDTLIGSLRNYIELKNANNTYHFDGCFVIHSALILLQRARCLPLLGRGRGEGRVTSGRAFIFRRRPELSVMTQATYVRQLF